MTAINFCLLASLLVMTVSCHDTKGSGCQCHYCKCERGNLYCLPNHQTFSFGLLDSMNKAIDKFFKIFVKKNKGKNYCYGPTEGESCYCDYCVCQTSFGHRHHHHHEQKQTQPKFIY